MENYKILNRIGKGAQGSVYLAEHRRDGRKYVVKKVECGDESEANKAFQEALALQKLQHPYICGYKEFFVTWEKEISAMFVCIVMDYYLNKDLASTLREFRERKEEVSEDFIEKKLGQLVETLIFIHKQGIIHRDLKPSNVFTQEDMSIAIGDFGVSCVMSDVLSRTRHHVGTMTYMAPEVLENRVDEKCDVWGLGCIALEMVTCHCLDVSEVASILTEIKHKPQALEEVLAQTGEVYSVELLDVVRLMLTIDHSSRPTSSELAEDTYIQQCLHLSEAILLQKQKRGRSGRRSPRPIPKEKGVQAMLDFIIDNLGDETAIRQTLEQLITTTKEEHTVIDPKGKKLMAKVMKDYITESDMQAMGCQIFSNLVITATASDALFQPDILNSIIEAMQSHPQSAEVQKAAASALMGLSADEAAAEQIGLLGGVNHLFAALQAFKNDPEVCTSCLNAIWSLAVNEENVRISTELKGIADVATAIETHIDHPELVEAGCAVILALVMEDDNLEVANQRDCVGLILAAVQQHMREARVVKNATMALAAMVEPDEESAYRVLSNKRNNEEISGVPIILDAYKVHKDNAEVVENLCTLIMELLEYDEICAEMKHLKVDNNVLLEVHKRFKDNADIMTPCESALMKIGGGKLPLQITAVKGKKSQP